MVQIKSVGVIGAGQMGTGIAHVVALGGYDVLLHDVSADRLAAGMDLIKRNMTRQVLDGGPLHPQMQAAVREIWAERVPASGQTLVRAPDLEVYPDGFQPDKAGAWVEWWIPVEG